MSALFTSATRSASRRLTIQTPTAMRSLALNRSATLPLNFRLYSDAAKDKEQKEEQKSDENLTEEQKKIKELETKLETKSKEAVELKDSLLRSVADFRNLQNVTKKDIQKAKDFALQKFAKDLLESVDNFGHALSAFKEEDLEKSKEISDLYTGVRMTRDVFEKTLKKHGIEKLDPIGETFDQLEK